ncbi:MAG: HIT domain-containing protein [Pseudomonadota bacterium]|jgi:diadenosine tetraphosphate (Ap4A) HIT family hydrolase|nr:HIT domain-containing protein [Alphaproteobacteria bacterium]
MYDINNIFAKILRAEIPCNKIEEDLYFLSFHDINPKASIHALVIPKGSYENAHDFADKATIQEIAGFWNGVNMTLAKLNLIQNGYRLITNSGLHGHQEVPHFHVHILGGQDLGSKMVMT